MTPRANDPQAPWTPSLGACVRPEGVFFRVWAPLVGALEVVVKRAGRPLVEAPLHKEPDGYFQALLPEARAGDEYRYRVDGKGPYPDPASRRQPRGVHGPSQIVDPGTFLWSRSSWRAPALPELVPYELHVGTFTPGGTFAAAAEKLPLLADLGVTAIELMPVADFPGRRNWGYDGVALFAPAGCYGSPDELRALVDAAHRLGLAVLLDVVYNHLGPDGNYTGVYSPYYFTDAHKSPWGAGVNLDRGHNAEVREFFIENARHWIHEYRLDGLRLDATHAMQDDGAVHFASELGRRVRASLPAGRRVQLIAEDSRNLARIVSPVETGGWGMDAVWADDFHHQMRRLLAGDRDGYYADFEDRPEDLAAILRQGWLYTGQHSRFLGGPRGTTPAGIDPARFVFCLQNHDQVGNRPFGERLNQQIDDAAYRAAATLLLTAPQTPLLFMGQEWGATTPFNYFTDHEPALGKLVTEGRRREFQTFKNFADPAARARIPDPQAPETFERSRLIWEERDREPHRGLWRLHQALLRLRRNELSRLEAGKTRVRVFPSGNGLSVYRPPFLCLAQLRLPGRVALGELDLPRARWSPALTTEDPLFCVDPQPTACRLEGPRADVEWLRPGALVLRALP